MHVRLLQAAPLWHLGGVRKTTKRRTDLFQKSFDCSTSRSHTELYSASHITELHSYSQASFSFLHSCSQASFSFLHSCSQASFSFLHSCSQSSFSFLHSCSQASFSFLIEGHNVWKSVLCNDLFYSGFGSFLFFVNILPSIVLSNTGAFVCFY